MNTTHRNRIKGHRKVRFGDLVLNESNPRIHSPEQRSILGKLYDEIGFARSVLAYELPDGRLKLIDGHLRATLTPDEVLDVEVLDVTEEEANVLLLSIDPLAQLAGYDTDLLASLRAAAEKDSAAVQALWQEVGEETKEDICKEPPHIDEQFLILIDCENEAEQVALLQRFQREGLRCSARVA